MEITDLLNKLENVKVKGNQYTAKCPAHDDNINSLTIRNCDGDKILLHCCAGCSTDKIIESLGISLSDLFYNKLIPSRRIVNEYCYFDLDGVLIHKTIKYEPKGFIQCRPDGKEGWIYNLNGIKPILYNLGGIEAARNNNETIFIVEGEKDCHTLLELGLQATTSCSGAGNWKEHYCDCLVNAKIVLIPDNDDAGRLYSEKIASSLKGRAKSIKLIDLKDALPDLPNKGDITDFFQILGKKVGLDKMTGLIDAAVEWTSENVATKSQVDWDNIIPFEDNNLPDFPLNCFPTWLQSYFDAVAEETQTPQDLSTVIGLSVLAATLAGKIMVEGKKGWVEPVNLYVAVIMKPGERKSAVFSHITKPLIEWEHDINVNIKADLLKNQAEKKIIEESLKNLQLIASKKNSVDDINNAMAKAEELANFKELKPVRIIADDVSPEKVSNLLAENHGRMSIMSAEGGIFEIMAGRYTQNAVGNFEVFLKGHSGDMLRVDRLGRGADHIKEPALNIGITMQPEVLRGIMQNSSFRGKGLTARFLFSTPKSKVGKRNIESKSIPSVIKEDYIIGIKKLLNMKDAVKPYLLTLSPEANTVSIDFGRALEPRLIGDLEYISDWASKLHGAILRIAGLLNIAEYIDEPEPFQIKITEDNLRRAVSIGEYFIEHNKAAFTIMGTDKSIEDAKSILRWNERQSSCTFKKYDVFRGNRGKFKKVEEVEPVLKILEAYNYIRERNVIYNGIGRKPDIIYEINPDISKINNKRG